MLYTYCIYQFRLNGSVERLRRQTELVLKCKHKEKRKWNSRIHLMPSISVGCNNRQTADDFSETINDWQIMQKRARNQNNLLKYIINNNCHTIFLEIPKFVDLKPKLNLSSFI